MVRLPIPARKRNATSTWISDFRGIWLALPALLLVSACAELGAGASLFGAPSQQAKVADGEITIVGPPGFCVDRSSLSRTASGDFVLLASCASISGNPSARTPGKPAVLTATVSIQPVASIDRSFDRLAGFFKSDKGRAALARDGRASSVKILQTRNAGGAFIVKVRDSSPARARGLEPEYWRALFDLRGRIVTLSVIEFSDKPMSDAEALATLLDFINGVRLANEPQESASGS